MRPQSNCVAARSRPAAPIALARSGSRVSVLIDSASASGSSGGTSRPVSPSATTSGMPPVFDATTAVPQAIASRFTMPSGSYTDGQANSVECDSSWMTSRLLSIPDSQMTPERVLRSSSTSPATSAPSSGVSGAPAHSTSWTSGSRWAAARSSTGTPFCRVIRPTNTTDGRLGSTP